MPCRVPIPVYCLVLALSLAYYPLPLIASDAARAYDQGVAAFELEDYRAALRYFRQAEALGLDDPALAYNLGASHYRLGNFEQARLYFLKAAESPDFAALSWFNLGLTTLQLEDTEGAIAWFRQAFNQTGNPRLRTLAGTMLERLDASPADIEPPAWSSFISTGIGHDDNVLLLSDDHFLDSSERSDFFLDMFAHGWRAIDVAHPQRSVDLDASLWLLRHAELGEFDISLLRTGGSMAQPAGNWDISASGHLAFTMLDADPFSLESLVNLAASTRLSPGALRLRYELGRIESLDTAYDYLGGWRHRIDARLTRLHETVSMQLLYQFEFNDRDDLTTPLFTSYSPVRNSLRMIVDIPLTMRLEVRTELQYDRSRYRQPNRLEDGSTVTRIDDRLGAALRLSYALEGGGEGFVEYRYTGNDSTLAVHDYHRHRLMTGLLILF